MALLPMYPGQAFSPQTALALTCGASDTSITVDNGDALPAPPNYLTLGTHGDADAETILYTVKSGNIISGLTRGIEGAAAAHDAGTIIGSYITAVEINKHKTNIEALDSGKENAGAVEAHNESEDAHGDLFAGKQAVIEADGILKGDGDGGVTAAVAGTDFVATNDSRLSDARQASDVSAWAKAAQKPSYNAADVGAVPTGRTVAGKALTADITLTAADVGADASGTATGAVSTHNASAAAHPGKMDRDVAVASIVSSRTLALTDAGKLLMCASVSAITVTVPTNASVAFPTGTQITLTQTGAGAVTVAAASGVTIRSKDAKLAIDGQYAAVTLAKVGTNEWYLWGALA